MVEKGGLGKEEGALGGGKDPVKSRARKQQETSIPKTDQGAWRKKKNTTKEGGKLKEDLTKGRG